MTKHIRTVLPFIVCVFIAFLLLKGMSTTSRDGPGRLALDAAEYYVRDFERTAREYDGAPFEAKDNGSEAMGRVKGLYEKFPENEKVRGLYNRVARSVKLSEGFRIEVTDEIIAYRNERKKLIETIGNLADTAFLEKKKALEGRRKKYISNAFPTPDVFCKGVERKILGSAVVLEDVLYPENSFCESGIRYLFLGEKENGYYYIRISGDAWKEIFEALRRYDLYVSGEFPGILTIVGTVVESTVLTPIINNWSDLDAANFGWVVEPEAVYAPGAVYVSVDEEQGSFTGEKIATSENKIMFGGVGVAKDRTPKEILKILISSIKSRDYDQYCDLISPEILSFNIQKKRLLKHWSALQRRFEREIIHVVLKRESEVEVVNGRSIFQNNSLERFFVGESRRQADGNYMDSDLIEEMALWVRVIHVTGRQAGRPIPIVLRRYAGGRWYIYKNWELL